MTLFALRDLRREAFSDNKTRMAPLIATPYASLLSLPAQIASTLAKSSSPGIYVPWDAKLGTDGIVAGRNNLFHLGEDSGDSDRKAGGEFVPHHFI